MRAVASLSPGHLSLSPILSDPSSSRFKFELLGVVARTQADRLGGRMEFLVPLPDLLSHPSLQLRTG